MNWQTLYTFASGELLWVSAALMLIGLIRQGVQIHGLTALSAPRSGHGAFQGNKPPPGGFRWSLGGREPLLAAVTLLFHAALLTAPLFISGHTVLIYQAFEVNIPALPGEAADVLTVTVMITGSILFLRRGAVKDIRFLSRPGDYGALVSAVFPFATGYAAYHGGGHHMSLMALHALSGCFFLAALGWTRMGHFVFFIYGRYLVRSEYSLARGSRRWYHGSSGKGAPQ